MTSTCTRQAQRHGTAHTMSPVMMRHFFTRSSPFTFGTTFPNRSPHFSMEKKRISFPGGSLRVAGVAAKEKLFDPVKGDHEARAERDLLAEID